MYYIIGLGNPDAEYEGSRHNIGRDIVQKLAKKIGADDFEFNKKINAQVSEGKIGKEKVMMILPDTYMNKSGNALKSIITSAKKAESMMVVYDDLDLPIGGMKISFNKSDGGHRGVMSIIKAVKTQAFPRLRIGISPATASGKLKKPHGEEDVVKHVLGKFSPKEQEALKKVIKDSVEALSVSVTDGYLIASNRFN